MERATVEQCEALVRLKLKHGEQELDVELDEANAEALYAALAKALGKPQFPVSVPVPYPVFVPRPQPWWDRPGPIWVGGPRQGCVTITCNASGVKPLTVGCSD